MALDDLFILCAFLAVFCAFLIAGELIARVIIKLWGKTR